MGFVWDGVDREFSAVLSTATAWFGPRGQERRPDRLAGLAALSATPDAAGDAEQGSASAGNSGHHGDRGEEPTAHAADLCVAQRSHNG